MKKLGDEGFIWTEENLDKWIADPKAMIPDSPMALDCSKAYPTPGAGRHHRLSEDAIDARLRA